MLFIFLRYLSIGISIIRGILIAKYLGPLFFGVYAFILTLQQQSTVLAFGMREAITIKTSEKGLTYFQRLAFNSTIGSFAFFIAILMIFAAFLERETLFLSELSGWSSASISISLWVGSTMVITEVLYNILRVKEYFATVGMMELVFAVCCLVFAIFEMRSSNPSVEQFFMCLLMGNLCVIATQVYILKKEFDIRFIKFALLGEIIATGFKMQCITLAIGLLLTAGHYGLASVLSALDFGIYTFGASLATLGLIGARTYTWMLYSKSLVLWSSANDVHVPNTANIIKQYQGILSIYMAMFGFLFVFVLPSLLSLFFPDYAGSEKVAMLLFCAGCCHLINFYEISLLIQRKQFGILFACAALPLLTFFYVVWFSPLSPSDFGDSPLIFYAALLLFCNLGFAVTTLLSFQVINFEAWDKFVLANQLLLVISLGLLASITAYAVMPVLAALALFVPCMIVQLISRGLFARHA